MTSARAFLLQLLAAALVGLPCMAGASSFLVSIDTTPLAGQTGFIAFDLYQGGAAITNDAVVSSFVTTATLGTPTLAGNVSGSLETAVTLRSTTFFNEFLQPVVFAAGATVFQLTLTENQQANANPDSFAIFLLNAARLPFVTTDPSGADALIVTDLVLPHTPQVYGSAFAVASVVPEPASASLLLAGLLVAGCLARRELRRR